MPYEHIEQIGDRSEERFALGLGARNVVGIMIGMLPMMLLSGNWPLLVRLPAMLTAMACGFIATITISGLPSYAWPIWWMRGHLTMLLNGRTITPEQLPGVSQPIMRAPIRVGGPIRAARRASVRGTTVAAPMRMVALGSGTLTTSDPAPTNSANGIHPPTAEPRNH
jgi:hypothetical protein